MAPDGTPGGGLSREDDKGNLHDDGNGRFVPKGDTGFNQPDGDGSSGDKPAGTGRIDENGVVHITTREVPDIRVERDKTINWYKRKLQGKTVTHPELGEILFTDKGIDHTADVQGWKNLCLSDI